MYVCSSNNNIVDGSFFDVLFLPEILRQWIQSYNLLKLAVYSADFNFVLDLALDYGFIASLEVMAAVVRVLWDQQIKKTALLGPKNLMDVKRIRINCWYPLRIGTEHFLPDAINRITKCISLGVTYEFIHMLRVDRPDV